MATRQYQGYPFTNPHVTDVPSIDAATASRWNNLPRRPVLPPTQPNRDVPGDSEVSTNESGKKSDPEPDPVIYIDVPESGDSDVAGPASPGPGYDQTPNGAPRGAGKKSEPEPDPVIYINVPESGDSDVAGPASPDPEPEYVQDTIFYDPFENRRIDRQKPADSPDTDSDDGPSRPTRPDTLDLHGASGSSGYASPAYTSTPGYLSKEASIYGRDDGFTLSPLPLTSSQYPEPPPAYSEIHTPQLHTPQTTEGTPSTPAEPPRTIVITQDSELNQYDPSTLGLPSPYRKVLHCQHCGHRVNTMVIWQTGFITHVVAVILLLIVLWPLVVLVYCTNVFKYKNHYCPNCNKKIGHEMPILCMNMIYAPTDTVIRTPNT